MRPGASQASTTVQLRRVSIADVIGQTEVMVRDGNGWQERIRSDLRPKGTAGPAKGELWLIERVGGIWMLSAMIGVPPRPVITGSRVPSDSLTVSLLDALVSTGLIDDLSTGIPSGDGGGLSGSYTHIQAVAASIWNIFHTLPYVPNVMVVDSAGTHVFGDDQVISPTHIRITFSSQFSGSAYLS